MWIYRRLLLALLLLSVSTLGGVPTGCSPVTEPAECLDWGMPCLGEEEDCCFGLCCIREPNLAGLLGERYCRNIPEEEINILLRCE